MKNGKLVATLGAVALVAAVGLGSTLAYLSAETDTVTNKFTLGNVSFGLNGGLAEQEVVLQNGKYVIGDGADENTTVDWVQTNTYAKVTPGETVAKNPTAFIGSDSEDAWLFVRVSKSADFEDIEFNKDLFTVVDDTNDAYTDLRLTEKAVKNGQYLIFSEVTVADVTNNETLDNITIKAALIQAEGITAEAAYTNATDLLE